MNGSVTKLQGRHKNSRKKKNSRNSGRPKFVIQPGGNNFKAAGGQKPKKQPGAKRPKSNKTAGIEKSVFFLKINEGQFCPRCPAGGPDLEKSRFFVFIHFSSHCNAA